MSQRRSLGFETGTGFLLALAGGEARRRWAAMLSAYELRPQHYGALMALHERGPLVQGELCDAIGVDARNAVELFADLRRRELTEQRVADVDRRKKVLTLTEEGRSLARELTDAGATVEDDYLRALNRSERDELNRLLRKVTND